MLQVAWRAQTPEPSDPLSTIFTMRIRIGAISLEVEGVFDTGADMVDLQPPMLAEFQVDLDQAGFSTGRDPQGNKKLIPIVIAEAELDGHQFSVPVALYPFAARPVHVFGRAGLLDHFEVTLDAAAAETRFEWTGKSAHSRIDAIRQTFVDPNVGQRQRYLAAGCT